MITSDQIISGSSRGHPDIGGRDIVPNLTGNWVYGFISGGSGNFPSINTNWGQNELIGVRQSGDQLIVGLFSEGLDNNHVLVDFTDPRESAILTKVNE